MEKFVDTQGRYTEFVLEHCGAVGDLVTENIKVK